MKKKLLAIALALVMLISLQPMSFASNTVIESGKWGDNLRWQVTSEGVLTISGKGDMAPADEFYPWHTPDNFENYTTVILEEGVTSIAKKAFSAFYGSFVTKLFLPTTIETIGDGAFSKSNMTEVHIPSIEDWMEIEIPGYGSPFSEFGQATLYVDGTPTYDITVPEGTTVIGNAQFMCFRTMTSIEIPKTVTRVEDYAFSNSFGELDSALTSIVFPESVEYIGYAALALNRNLEKITILNPNCELDNVLMDEWGLQSYSTCTVYGYAGSTAEELAKKYDLPFIAIEDKPEEKPTIKFSDLKPGAWYEEPIMAAAEAGIIAGNADGTYNPNGQLTWAQAIVFAVRVDQLNKGKHVYGAEDQGSPWYQVYVDYALQKHIIDEVPKNLNAPITRGDAAVIFHGATIKGLPQYVNMVPDDYFTDVLRANIKDGSDEDVYLSVYTLARLGIVNGMGNGSFGVNENFTRAQVATIVARMAGLADLAIIK